MKLKRLPELYLVSGSNFDDRKDHLYTIEESLKAGCKIVQLREKHLDDIKIYSMALKLRELTKKYNALFIIDDRADICKAVDADGVHIGQEDLPVNIIRDIIGDDKIVGKSTHSEEQAKTAVEEGVDYIGVGPVFETNSKKGVCAPVGLKLVKYVSKNIDIPFVAIGGIKLDNIYNVKQAGAKSFACITGIIKSEDPYNTTRGYLKKIQE